MDTQELLNRLGNRKERKKGKKSRKHGRQYRFYGADHSQTLYRSRGQREKNKARRAAKRERRLQILRDKKNAVHFEDNRTKDQGYFSKGSGSPQR